MAVAQALGRSSPRLSRLRQIIRRQEPNLTVVDGRTLLLELLQYGIDYTEVYATAPHWEMLLSVPAIAALEARGSLFLLDDATAVRIAPSQHGQGVLGVVRVPRHHLEQRLCTVFLDRIQDPGNLGTIIRTAAAFGVDQVLCSPGSADPFSPRAVRASAGHALRLPVVPGVSFSDQSHHFLPASGELVGTASAGGVALLQWRPTPPLVLAFGNEGSGLAPEILSACTSLVTIPLAAGVESLNVAVSAGIIFSALPFSR